MCTIFGERNVYTPKSKRLKSRQKGMDVNIIAYADKATERLKKKYQKLIERNVPGNKAIVAVARELACFIWDKISIKIEKTNERRREERLLERQRIDDIEELRK